MELKSYQQKTLETLRLYLGALQETRAKSKQFAQIDADFEYEWDREAWKKLGYDRNAYFSRKNGIGESIPNICFQIPTGGGKTYLGVKAIDIVNNLYQGRQTGLVLWLVPTTEIYRQTLRAFRDRTHPYRQQFDLASGGKTLIVEKDARFSQADVQEQLVVLLLMMPSANRRDKEFLRLFRDQGGFDSFFPPDDQWQQHGELLKRVPNLDTFESESFSGNKVVKTSLGNTLRLLNPLVVLDEGHKSASTLARDTLSSFNPSFILELSATPPPEANKLVQVSGREVHREGMIKLDVNLTIKATPDWHDVLLASHEQRANLERVAQQYAMNGGDYIRPICLIQVERTGENQRRAGVIHAEDAREFLIERCGILPEQIAVKSAELDELADIDLFSPDCPIRYIITKSALQEGWDCSFAYVLAVLTNAEAASSLTQLVGRILRQPYARKTGITALDESYVYCFRDRSGKALQAVKTGLSKEGLGDVAGRVVVRDDGVSNNTTRIDVFARSTYRNVVGKVYLPCFVLSDELGHYREIKYEIDVLSRIDWSKVNLGHFDTLELNPSERQDAHLKIGFSEAIPSMSTTTANDGAIDLAFITRQIIDTVPSPWAAYDFVKDAISRLKLRYSEDSIRRDLGFMIEELKRILSKERDRLAEEVFRNLIQQDQLHFYLLSGHAGGAIPDRITVPANAPRLTTEVNAPLQRNLFEYVPEAEFNEVERAVALYLDEQEWVLAWYRNMVRAGYSIQGWHKHHVYPDFIAMHQDTGDPAKAKLSTIYVLETKGIHLKNEDTSYKQELFALCNEHSKPTPWDAIAEQFSNHKVHFQVIFDDEWKSVLNAMLRSSD